MGDTFFAHALLTHRRRDAEAKQQVLHAVRHRPRRREVADATRASSGSAGRARDGEQPAEEQRQLTARQSEHCIGDATRHRRAEQAVTRGDGLDAVSGAAPRHDSVRDMPTGKRNRAHSGAIGVHDKVGDHGRRGAREHAASGDSVAMPDEVREQDDLCGRKPVVTEERQRVGHRDLHAHAEIAERQPPAARSGTDA